MMDAPRLMLLDEPFCGRDGMSRELPHDRILRLYAQERQTSPLITSEMDD